MDERIGGLTTLGGLKVLDLTRNLAGPYCTMTLGDLGADVVKIEDPRGGDDSRRWAPPSWGGEAAAYLAANRNKRSVVVDIDQPEGADIIRSLALQSDVVVQSFRAGSLVRRGLDYDSIAAANPGVIYCSISAYGDVGPKRDLPGYDPVIQASTGIMHMTGEADGPPVRLGIGAIDLGAGIWTTIGVLAALDERRRTGKGTHVQTSLFEIGVWWLSYHFVGHLATGHVPGRSGTSIGFISPYQAYNTADGTIFVAGANDNLFARLAREVGLPELVDDPRFLTNQHRIDNRAPLVAALQRKFLDDTASNWEVRLQKAGVPCSRVRTIADVAADEQLAALGLVRSVEGHPTVPDLRLVDMPTRRGTLRAERFDPPPLFDQHTDGVLAELGYESERVAALRERGIVGPR